MEIDVFYGNFLFGVNYCGSYKSLLTAAPSGVGSTGVWVDTPLLQRPDAAEAKFTHTHYLSPIRHRSICSVGAFSEGFSNF